MATTYLMTTPVLIYNLGVEMIYILCSRLKAQSVPEDKSHKVIRDLVSALLDHKFQSEMKKRQELIKYSALRAIFDRLVHSSIMRLNTNSMNKLFDLMLMSFKLQLVRTKFAEEILQVTVNHLRCLVTILKSSSENADLVQKVEELIEYFNKTYSVISPYDFIVLKQNLMRFFQGKNVKVSIFIQDKLQANNGTLLLSILKEESPPSVRKPGEVVIYKEGLVKGRFNLNLKLSEKYIESKTDQRVLLFTTKLGENMFSDENRKNVDLFNFNNETYNQTSEKEDNTNKLTQNECDNNINKLNAKMNSDTSSILKDCNSYYKDTSLRKGNIELIKKEYGALSDLLGCNINDESQLFSIDLFKRNAGTNKEEQDDYIDIEIDNNLGQVKSAFDDFDTNREEGDNDDLLALMDQASLK